MTASVDEAARLKIIAEHDLDALSNDPALKSVTDFLADLCDAPICLVSLVESERQCFLARTGLDATETERSSSFCQFTMVQDSLLVVPDARVDPRFANNPLVTGDLAIRFYAGAALRSAEDAPLGALCIIDQRPRSGLTPLQAKGLRVLAEQVARILRDSRLATSRTRDCADLTSAVRAGEQRFRVLADTMPQMVWSTLPDGFHDYYNARWYEFTGVPAGSTDGEAWNGVFHPDDQERAWTRWRHSLATSEPYEIEYRLRAANGEYRWTLGRALPMRDESGHVIRWFGTCTDIHDQKLLLDQRQAVNEELSHRIKNLFSIIAGMISMSARRFPNSKDMAADLRERIVALGRAHDFTRPQISQGAGAHAPISLNGLLRQLFAPYSEGGSSSIEITGDDAMFDDSVTTPFALLFHELATNAAKYGALSRSGGKVHLDVAVSPDATVLTWTETGGPVVDANPKAEGFGTQLIDLAVTRQLSASLSRIWHPTGLELKLSVPRKPPSAP